MPRGVRFAVAVAVAHVLVYAAGATPVLAAPAEEPPTIASVRTPKVVVLPASTKSTVTTSFRITLRVKDSDGVDTVVAGLYAPGRSKGIALRARRTGGSAGSGTWTATARLDGTQPPGTWKVQAFATDREQRTTDPSRVYASYEVRTPTRVADFGVAEPVAAGARLKVGGRLQRWTGKNGWVPYADREVTLQFRPAGGRSFAIVDTLTTGENGSVAAAEATAEKVGTWRISFAGHETRAASVSREDEVRPVEEKKEDSEERPTASPQPTPPRPTPAPEPSTAPQPAGTSSTGAAPVRSGAPPRR